MEKEKIVGNIDHVVIAVRDMGKAKEFFSDLLETEFVDLGAIEEYGWRSAMSPGGVELLSPTRPDSDLAKFLDRRGEGLYALAFTVQDADKAKAKAEEKGIRVVGDTGEVKLKEDLPPIRELWLHPKDNYGVYVMFTQGLPYHPWETEWYKP